ncbi:hypothetical protein CLOM_g23914 [Closterium sp. NIES-68]|nr:hypothetical protein CLOM_g23914 [Closterium sp. NIES-68]
MRLWQACAVLPLSTVEGVWGFSRQNVIKSWVWGALCNACLNELMVISLLQYEIDWDKALECWRKKLRRPAKSALFASEERKRKAKVVKGAERRVEKEAVPDYMGDWADDEGEEGEEMGEAPVVEDNPFLSDDEAEDEVNMDAPEF